MPVPTPPTPTSPIACAICPRWNKGNTYPELLHNRAISLGVLRHWKRGQVETKLGPDPALLRSKQPPHPLWCAAAAGGPPFTYAAATSFLASLLFEDPSLQLRNVIEGNLPPLGHLLCHPLPLPPPSAGKSPPRTVSVDWAETWSGFCPSTRRRMRARRARALRDCCVTCDIFALGPSPYRTSAWK